MDTKGVLHQRKTGLFLLAITIVLWGLAWPLSKLVLNQIEPWTFRASTVTLAGLSILLGARFSGRTVFLSFADARAIAFVAVFNITAWHLLSAFGLSLIEASRAVIVAYTMPIWAVTLSVSLKREQGSHRKALALVLVVVALGLLIHDEFGRLRSSPLGVTLLLTAAFSWACGTVMQKSLRTTLPIASMTGWQLLIGSVPILFGMVIWGAPSHLAVVSPVGIVGLATIVLIMIVCYWTWFTAVSLLPVWIVAPSTAMVPVIGVCVSSLIFGQPIAVTDLLALPLVAAALVLIAVDQFARRPIAHKTETENSTLPNRS